MKACASLEDGISTMGPSNANNVMGEAPSIETVVIPLLSTRQFNLGIGGSYRPKGPDRLVLNSPVKPMNWDHPSGPDSTQSIINC